MRFQLLSSLALRLSLEIVFFKPREMKTFPVIPNLSAKNRFSVKVSGKSEFVSPENALLKLTKYYYNKYFPTHVILFPIDLRKSTYSYNSIGNEMNN